MNEAELAEKFNLELDAVMAGAEPAFSPDPGAMVLAAAFARADFSGDSLIKESLRERIAARPGLLETLRALLANNYARAAFAAAVLTIALLPLARRQAPQRAVPDLPQFPVVAEGSRPALPPLPAPAPQAAAAPDGGFFAAIPMRGLETQRLEEFPIAPAGRIAPGLFAAGGPAAGFPIENRPVSLDELFERRSI